MSDDDDFLAAAKDKGNEADTKAAVNKAAGKAAGKAPGAPASQTPPYGKGAKDDGKGKGDKGK